MDVHRVQLELLSLYDLLPTGSRAGPQHEPPDCRCNNLTITSNGLLSLTFLYLKAQSLVWIANNISLSVQMKQALNVVIIFNSCNRCNGKTSVLCELCVSPLRFSLSREM